jgi:hypothetical protein
MLLYSGPVSLFARKVEIALHEAPRSIRRDLPISQWFPNARIGFTR